MLQRLRFALILAFVALFLGKAQTVNTAILIKRRYRSRGRSLIT
jgi:hypothetical protein